jgi:hypothetical protein
MRLPPLKQSTVDVLQKTLWREGSTISFHTIPFSTTNLSRKWIPSQIQFANAQEQHAWSFELPVGKRKCNLFLQIYREDKTPPETYLHAVLSWLQYLDSIAQTKCSQQLNVYLLMTPAEKHLPASRFQPLDKEHVNTAFTMSCQPNNEIVVFRREEWFKVFVHETMHAFGLDFSSAPSSQQSVCNDLIHKNIPGTHPVDDLRLNESYCEMWAELTEIMVRAKGKKTEFTQIWKAEVEFSLFQATKVLWQSGHRSFREYLEPNDKGDNGKETYRENTHAFTYYVLRSALLFHIDEFMEWCLQKNRPLLQFSVNSCSDYCMFTIKCCKNPLYLKAMDKMHKQYKAMVAGVSSCSRTLMSTLRMQGNPQLYDDLASCMKVYEGGGGCKKRPNHTQKYRDFIKRSLRMMTKKRLLL